jgi:hypothetical protein
MGGMVENHPQGHKGYPAKAFVHFETLDCTLTVCLHRDLAASTYHIWYNYVINPNPNVGQMFKVKKQKCYQTPWERKTFFW